MAEQKEKSWLETATDTFVKGKQTVDDLTIALGAFAKRFFKGARLSKADDLVGSQTACCHLIRKDLPILNVREEGTILTGLRRLHYYYYDKPGSKELVLIVHGIGSQADGDESILADRMIREGYSVMMVDLTGHGRSGGAFKGLDQAASDVADCVKFIQKTTQFATKSLYLIGFSLGAFAVCASMNLLSEYPTAVASLSGFDSPHSEMMAMAASKAGPLVLLNSDALRQAITEMRGEGGHISSVDGINKASKTRFLVAAASNDEVITGRAKIINNLRGIKNPSRVFPMELPGKRHNETFYSDSSNEYSRDVVMPLVDGLTKKYGKWKDIPIEERMKLSGQIDRSRSSRLDETLIQAILSTFRN